MIYTIIGYRAIVVDLDAVPPRWRYSGGCMLVTPREFALAAQDDLSWLDL